LRAVATIGTGLINERFLAGQRRGESILGATFTVDEINLLKVAFDAAMTEAKAKGFEYLSTRCCATEKLKAMVLAAWNGANRLGR